MKSSLDNLTIKMESALSAKKCYNNEVTTDVGTQSNDGRENRDGTVDETEFDMSFTGFESETPNDQQLIKLFRRLTLPFKKANRRLRDMEDIGRQLESTMGEIRSSVQIAAADFDQKFNDFFNMTLEMFEHQHHQFELGDRKLGGIKLSCSGIASDLSDFKAKTEAFLDKIESGSLMSGSIENESRSREALRFESARILSVLKDHENLMIDGFDSCSSSSAINRIAEDATEITLTAPVQLEPSTTPRTPEVTSTETEVTPIDSVVTAALVEGQPQIVSEAEKVLQTCEQLMEAGFLENKVYNMEGLTEESSSFRKRFCDQTTSGGGWTVIQRRGSIGNGNKVNFTRPWFDYKHGFVDLDKDFWYGNDNIYKLTNDPKTSPISLKIVLEDFEGNSVVAEYATFRIESESSNYRIWIGGYTGNATDSLSAHNGSKFSTYDIDNDSAPKCCPCAPSYGGGWWFYSCFEANLNGEYHEDPEDNDYYRGIIWELWKGDYSLKSAKMMIRSKAFNSDLSET